MHARFPRLSPLSSCWFSYTPFHALFPPTLPFVLGFFLVVPLDASPQASPFAQGACEADRRFRTSLFFPGSFFFSHPAFTRCSSHRLLRTLHRHPRPLLRGWAHTPPHLSPLPRLRLSRPFHPKTPSSPVFETRAVSLASLFRRGARLSSFFFLPALSFSTVSRTVHLSPLNFFPPLPPLSIACADFSFPLFLSPRRPHFHQPPYSTRTGLPPLPPAHVSCHLSSALAPPRRFLFLLFFLSCPFPSFADPAAASFASNRRRHQGPPRDAPQSFRPPFPASPRFASLPPRPPHPSPFFSRPPLRGNAALNPLRLPPPAPRPLASSTAGATGVRAEAQERPETSEWSTKNALHSNYTLSVSSDLSTSPSPDLPISGPARPTALASPFP